MTSELVEPAQPKHESAFVAFRYRNFRWMWSASLLSSSGSWLQMVAVPYVVYTITGSGAWLGFAGFLGYAPMVITGPYAGFVADRFDRRKVLIIGGIIQAAITFVLWIVWVQGVRNIAFFLVILTLGAFAGGFTVAAWQSFVTELVPREHLLNAVTLNSTQFNAARAFGPALGGVVLATLGVSWCFFINGVTFLAMVGVLMVVSVPPLVRAAKTGKYQPLAEMREAMGYVRTVPGIVTCLIVVFSLGLLVGPLFNLLVVFATDVYDIGDGAYGVLAACLGAGAIIVAPIVAGRGGRANRSRVLAIAMVGYGAALIALGAAPVAFLGGIALLFAGAGYLGITASLNTTVQLQVKEEMRGRTMALYLMTLTAAVPLGALIQGWLVDVIGVQGTVAGAGALFLVVFAILRFGFNRLTTMDAIDHAFGPDDALHIAEAEATEAAIDPL
ncbi:MAG: MFS transporter [Acidimicrobiales bacterium]